jgi:exonuclease VII large subunit
MVTTTTTKTAAREATLDVRAASALVELIERQSRAMAQLADGLTAERESFVSVHASRVEQALARLEDSAQKARELERVRVERLAELLGTNAHDAARTRGSRIRTRVPVSLRPRFDAAIAALREATSRVQVETRLGQRLLQFAGETQEQVFRALYGADDPRKPGSPGHGAGIYDRAARAMPARTPARSGHLIDGTV